MFILKIKKFFLIVIFVFLCLKISSGFVADYSKIDELYKGENFTIFLIFKEDPYRIKEIYIILSDFNVEKRFKMNFDGNKAFVSILFDSLPKKDFYYYFEILTKDNNLEYLPEMIQERTNNMVKFVKEKELKKEIILLLPENERKIDPDNFTFSVYIPEGTKDVKIVMDGEDITKKCLIGEKILTYAPEKLLKPSRYRIDLVKEGKLAKTYYFNISNKDFFKNLFNGEMSYNFRYEPNILNNFFNSYLIYFYGNVSNFLYNFKIQNSIFWGENFWNKNKINIHLNFKKVNLNLLDLYYYDSFSNYGLIPLKGFSFSYQDSLTCLSNIIGEIMDSKKIFSSITFDKKFKFYGFGFENMVLKDSLFYINFKLKNNLYLNKKGKLFFNISSPFVFLGNDFFNGIVNLNKFSHKVGIEIDLKKYYALTYLMTISHYDPNLFYHDYIRFLFKNQIFITKDLVLAGDLVVKNDEQNKILFFNSTRNDLFTNLNLIYSNKNLPSLFFSITNNIFSRENFENNKNFILKITTGTFYDTKLNEFDLSGKFFINQTNYKFSEEEKNLSTEYNFLFSSTYKNTFRTSASFKTLITDEKIERIIDEKYGLYFGYLSSKNRFSMGLFTQIFLKKDFGGLKKMCLSFSPDLRLKFKFISLNFYPCFHLDLLTNSYYGSLSINSSTTF
ncbi:MAG: hypothetical protein ABIN11_04225 [candidate division WOR-3 bacterium]